MIKVALAQINATVGDLAGNARRIVDAARRAHAAGARLLVAPELALVRLPAGRPAAAPGVHAGLRRRTGRHGGRVGVVRGFACRWSGIRISSVNAAMLGPSPARSRCASMRPRCWWGDASSPPTASANCRTTRSSTSGATSPPAATRAADRLVFEVGGVKVGVLICEDAWFDEPAQAARAAGAQVLAVINASPFHLDKAGEREAAHGRARARDGSAAAVLAPGRRPGRGGVRRCVVRARCTGCRAHARTEFR